MRWGSGSARKSGGQPALVRLSRAAERQRGREGEAESCERGMAWRGWDGAVAEARGMQTSRHSVELKVQFLKWRKGGGAGQVGGAGVRVGD